MDLGNDQYQGEHHEDDQDLAIAYQGIGGPTSPIDTEADIRQPRREETRDDQGRNEVNKKLFHFSKWRLRQVSFL